MALRTATKGLAFHIKHLALCTHVPPVLSSPVSSVLTPGAGHVPSGHGAELSGQGAPEEVLWCKGVPQGGPPWEVGAPLEWGVPSEVRCTLRVGVSSDRATTGSGFAWWVYFCVSTTRWGPRARHTLGESQGGWLAGSLPSFLPSSSPPATLPGRF